VRREHGAPDAAVVKGGNVAGKFFGTG